MGSCNVDFVRKKNMDKFIFWANFMAILVNTAFNLFIFIVNFKIPGPPAGDLAGTP